MQNSNCANSLLTLLSLLTHTVQSLSLFGIAGSITLGWSRMKEEILRLTWALLNGRIRTSENSWVLGGCMHKKCHFSKLLFHGTVLSSVAREPEVAPDQSHVRNGHEELSISARRKGRALHPFCIRRGPWWIGPNLGQRPANWQPWPWVLFCVSFTIPAMH